MNAPAISKFRIALRVALGLAVMAVWLAIAGLWMVLSLSATLMANDSGSASQDAHTGFILGAIAGQILCGLAGLPLGTAVFWAGSRRLLLWVFAGLFLAGLAVQICAAWFFFSTLP